MNEKQLTNDKAKNELLRSINIVFDSDHPERISHYTPTTKSIHLLKRLLSDDKAKSC